MKTPNSISAFSLLIFLFISSPYLNAQTILYGTTNDSLEQNIFTIKKDGTTYQEFNPCTFDYGKINLVGINLEGDILGTTCTGGNHNFGIYFKVDTEGNNFEILKHFENEQDTSFVKKVISSDGKIFGHANSFNCSNPNYIYDSRIFSLTTNGDFDDFVLTEMDILDEMYNVKDGEDGFIYFNGGNKLYKISKTTLEVSLVYEFIIGGATVSFSFNFEPSPDGKIFGIITKTIQEGNGGISNPFKYPFSVNKNGSQFTEYSCCGRFDIFPLENEKVLLLDDDIIYSNNSTFSNQEIIKTFDDNTGSNLLGLIVGQDEYLYGTTKEGGNFGFGTIYKMKQDGSGFSIIKHFEKNHSSILEWQDLTEPIVIPEPEPQLTFEVFPNPTSNSLTIKFPNPDEAQVDISIFDEIGKLMLESNSTLEKIEFQTNHLAIGVYFVQVKNKEIFFTGKFLKN